jgi:hypothetical protein
MEKTIITKEMREDLRKSFPDEAYSKHPTKTFLTTLKAMYVTERLNDVFGLGRWSIDHEVIERTNDYVLIQGTFKCLDYEVIVPSQYGGHKTSGTNTEMADGFKSAITDCISKIASYLEVGIDMFKGKKNISGTTNNNKKDETPVKWLNDKQSQTVINNGLDKIKECLAYYDGKTVRDDGFKYCISKKLKLVLETALKI